MVFLACTLLFREYCIKQIVSEETDVPAMFHGAWWVAWKNKEKNSHTFGFQLKIVLNELTQLSI